MLWKRKQSASYLKWWDIAHTLRCACARACAHQKHNRRVWLEMPAFCYHRGSAVDELPGERGAKKSPLDRSGLNLFPRGE